LLAQNTQLEANVQASTSLLNSTDAALTSITAALNTAKGLALSGIGDASSPQQKAAMAAQVQALIQQVVNAGTSTFAGRNLFGGTQNPSPPFALAADGSVVYFGDQQSLTTFADISFLQPPNVDGNTALGVLPAPITADLDPALTLA